MKECENEFYVTNSTKMNLQITKMNFYQKCMLITH